VLADDRESASGVPDCLRALPDVELQIQRLKLGDYVIDGHLIVERKQAADFAASIVDGRLFRQAQRLTAAKRPALLIIEGSAADWQALAVSRESLQGALISLSLIYGLPVLRARTPEETARLMLYAARQLRATSQGTAPRTGYRPHSKRRRQLYLLQGLPGVGPARAAALLDKFGTVQGALMAGPEAWADIPGIGKETARKMDGVLRETATAYAT